MEKEKRLIDANDFLDLFYVASAGQDKAFIKAVEMVAEDTPTVDAVEVVRCKDCEFCVYNSCNDTYKCRSMSGMFRRVEPDEFCSYGERREGECPDHARNCRASCKDCVTEWLKQPAEVEG